MKKTLSVLLLVCLLLGIAGCQKAPDIKDNNAGSTSESSDKPDNKPNGPVSQAPMVSVSLPVITKSEKADDGKILLQYIYQDISLVFSDPHVSEAIILDFLNRIDSTRSTAESLLADAKAAYTGNSNWTPYQCLISYEPMRIDVGALSMFGSFSTYNGMSHPETSYVAANYDFATGKALTLGDILTNSATPDTIKSLVISVLNAQKTEKRLYPDFEATVTSQFSGNIANSQAWYLSDAGLCFYYSPYEIAPYSSGVVIAEIPYNKLVGILKDEFFPAEQDAAEGGLFIEMFQNANLDKFTQSSDIVLDTDGEKFFLFTDKAVHNIRIETGTWSANGSHFAHQHTVLAAVGLTPGDAIMIQANLPDTLPNLRVTYQTDDGEKSFFLIKKGDTAALQEA